jgi:serine/threonine protein kinase
MSVSEAGSGAGRRGTHPQNRSRTPQDMVGRWLHDGMYKIEAVLGQGGMGQVFLATHATLQIPLALKRGRLDHPVPEVVIAELDRVLHGDALIRRSAAHSFTEQDFPLSEGIQTDRFIREALLLARLNHPTIPALYDYFLEDGYWFLVMDYIPGPTLSAYMQQHAPLQPLEALNYAMQLCDVLDYLHKQSPPVVFRDVKPSNVILAPDGRVMLVDFGIARYFKVGQMNDTTEFGSPGYAPPEQYEGGGQTDGRSDLYSLGVILHEMLSGKRPVRIGEQLESLHYLNAALSPVLSGLVTVATRAEPMYRFQSAHMFYLALERAYLLEERRNYVQCIQKAETSGSSEWSNLRPLLPVFDESADDTLPTSTSFLVQREQVRQALQEARNEQEEQDRAETHLTSIDESLRQRSSMGLLSATFPLLSDHDDEQTLIAGDEKEVEDEKSSGITARPRPLSPQRRLVVTLFALALIVFVIFASMRYIGLFSSRGPTPTVTATAPTRTQTQPTETPERSSTATLSGSWTTLPSLPSPNADNASAYVTLQGQGYIYMSGGFHGLHQIPQYDRSLYRYDVAAAHWETVSNIFPGMGNNAAALDEQGHLFFTVGYSPQLQSVESLLYIYQPATGLLQKIIPPPGVLVGYGATMYADQQGHLYLTQGFMAAGDSHEIAGQGWYRFDIATAQWQLLASLPAALGYVTLAPDGSGGIYMLGGSSDAGQTIPSTHIYRYDIARNSWTTEPIPAPAALSGSASCLNGSGQLVLIGGFDAQHNTSLNQVWLVNLHTLRWTALVPIPNGGSLLGTAACDGHGHVYLTRGANNPSTPTSDFLELTLPS